MFYQEIIAFAEMMTAEESRIGGEWARVSTCEYQMVRISQNREKTLRMIPPQHEYDWSIDFV